VSGARRVFACRAEEVRPGGATILALDGRSIGLFRVDGAYHALLNRCPHRGAALCEGPVCGTTRPTDGRDFAYDRPGGIIRCAWHGWEFDIRTGAFLVDPKVRARTFPVHVEGGDLYVEM